MSRLEIRIEDAGGFDEIEVLEVFVTVGVQVASGDPVVEVATDKANQEIQAPASGTIVEILVHQDDIISPDQILAVLETE